MSITPGASNAGPTRATLPVVSPAPYRVKVGPVPCGAEAAAVRHPSPAGGRGRYRVTEPKRVSNEG